ncbi:Heterokaryon incompatibility protein 6 [Cladobotryum mycophilum]|uniref:Heterokaryon incompatibility protein 6 n=1 Tax=Cladobotryum mycophilum TaxID=491253 RepID=A0ABR0SX28_9HYPO
MPMTEFRASQGHSQASFQDVHKSDDTAAAVTKDDESSDPDDYGVYADEDDEQEHKWIKRENWHCIQTACLVFVLEEGLPVNQRWMFYLLFIHFHQDLYPSFYVYSVIPVFIMWYFPEIGRPSLVQAFMTAANQYMRMGQKSSTETTKEFSNIVFFYVIPLSLFIYAINLEGSIELLESIFGPALTWPQAILPITPWLFLSYAHEKDSLNGFVSEGKQGILMAVFVRACAAVLPLWLQWILWSFYTGPAAFHPAMVVEWIFCATTWTYPQARSWFRNNGGGPSIILQRERRGTLWFTATTIVMRIIEGETESFIIKTGALDLSPQIWLPLALIFVIGLYLLRYGLAIRIAKYQHKPLENKQSIRLLRLRAQPCNPSSPVQCDMIHSTLKYPPPYIAVSHRWGKPEENHDIILIEGSPFLISPSLHAFLRAKRSSIRHVIVWIDSICINQADTDEKSIQVGMMRRIYEEALFTIGWLGEDPDAEKAFRLVERVITTRTTSAFTELWNEEDAGWDELKQLLSNDWFERVWIIQEVAVAKKSFLRYGSQEIEWGDFAKALSIIMALGTQAGQIENFGDSRGALNTVIMENIRLQVDDVDYLKLKDMLKLGLNFKATLLVDKVYALLGVIEERRTPLFHPRFSTNESFSEVISRRRVWGDFSNTLRAINDLLSTANGGHKTRTGRWMLRSTDRGVRHFAALTRDLQKVTE